MAQEKVLIVEDEENERTGLAELVSAWGYRTETAKDGVEGLEKVTAWSPGIVITDMKMPRMTGIELLERVAAQPQPIAVILLTAQGNIEIAVDAMKSGAYDFIQKPVDPARLKTILNNAARQQGTERELEVSRRKLRDTGLMGSLVGPSKKMQEIFHLIEQVAPSSASVLITGESGTGKELVARTIHNLSPRKNAPFVAINCSAIPETLMESELFGHEKGAFTGAASRRQGCFELAHSGTLLLDEIAEMPTLLQAKLLRVLEERSVRRLGSTQEIPVDVRLLAATNKNPEEAVVNGVLREDLFYRLNVIRIELPPLRERKDDLPLLAQHLLTQLSQRDRRPARFLSPPALQALQSHTWPGNVRELRNTIERAVIICSGEEIERLHLAPYPVDQRARVRSEDTLSRPRGTPIEEVERQMIMRTLQKTDNNKTRAAELLGISLKTLHNKLRLYRERGQMPDAHPSLSPEPELQRRTGEQV